MPLWHPNFIQDLGWLGRSKPLLSNLHDPRLQQELISRTPQTATTSAVILAPPERHNGKSNQAILPCSKLGLSSKRIYCSRQHHRLTHSTGASPCHCLLRCCVRRAYLFYQACRGVAKGQDEFTQVWNLDEIVSGVLALPLHIPPSRSPRASK